MPSTLVIPPAALSIEPSTGRMANATRHYQKRFKDLSGLYADAAAYAAMLPAISEVAVYEVWEHRTSAASGDLVFGTCVMRPGQVGDEFFFTRGHRHQVADRSEIYHCLGGTGVMLMEHSSGEVSAQPLAPQALVYVPPHWIHRSVNTGAYPLITVFCYAADAGQDYGVIENAGGMRVRVVSDGVGGWKLVNNSGWRPGGESALEPGT